MDVEDVAEEISIRKIYLRNFKNALPKELTNVLQGFTILLGVSPPYKHAFP